MAEAHERPRFFWTKTALKLAFGIVLFVLVLRYLAPNWDELIDRVELHLGWALVGLSGTVLASIVTAARWKLLADVMGGTRLPFIVYFHGIVFTRFLGQFTSMGAMDLIGRGWVLRSAGSERSIFHPVMQVVLERSLDAALPLMLLAWAFAVKSNALPMPPEVSLLLACVLFLGLAIPLLRPGVRITMRVYMWLRVQAHRFRKRKLAVPLEELQPVTVDVKLSAKVAGYSLLRFGTVMLQFWGIARAVGIHLSWQEIASVTPVAQLAGLIGITPGGLGVLEAGWAGGLRWIGLDDVAISIFVLAQRIGVIVFFGLLSAIAWPLAKRARSNASHAAP